MQGNAEASSSRLSGDEEDVMDVDEEGFEDDDLDGGAWDEDPQEYDSDDSGSRDDYVEEAGSDEEGETYGQRLEAGEAAEDEPAPEEGFDRLADVLKKTMSSVRGDPSSLANLPELQGDMASHEYGQSFQDEIAAMGEESESELLGDFYGRVLRPGRKQAKPQKKKGRIRQSRHRPAPEVQALMGQANLAYIQSNFEEAIPLLLEVVRIDNKVHSAYMTLATCHRMLGNEELSLQADLVAAHLDGDAETWKDLALRSKELPQQALYCYKKALKLAPDDSESLYKLAMMYKDAGDEKKAFTHLKKLLETSSSPHDFNILLELSQMLSRASQNLDVGCQYYREAFEYHLIHFDGPADQQPGKINNLDVNALIVLVDLLMMQEDYETAVDCIKRGQRWLDGRGTDQTWAHREDDLEYLPKEGDPPGGGHRLDSNLRHRLGLARLKLGDDEQALQHIDIITKLNIVEWQQFWIESAEALMKRPQLVQRALELLGDLVNNEDIDYNAKVVTNFALCQQQLGNYEEAIGAFEHVVKQDPDNLDVLLKLASAYEDAGQLQQALATVREVQARREVAQPSRRGRRVEDEVEPEGADPESAFIRGVIRRKKTRRAARKTTDREKEMQEAAANTRALWEDVKYAEQGVSDGIRGAIDAFLEASGDMIEIFRMAKQNFGKDRGVKLISMKTKRKRDAEAGMVDLDEQARLMQSRLEEAPTGEEQAPPEGEAEADGNEKIVVQQTHFHGISAEDWLAIIVKHCCVLTVRNDGESALDILEHVVAAGMFYVSPKSLISLRLTAMAVAMRMRDVDKVIEHEHMLATTMQWRVEPKLILLGCLGHGEDAKEAFTRGPLQKRIHRELRLYNATTTVEHMRWYPGRRRWVLSDVDGDGNRRRDRSKRPAQEEEEEDDEEDEDRTNKRNQPVIVHQHLDINGTPVRSGMDPTMNWLPSKRHPVPYIIYGLNMMSARTYQSALYYLLRAYELDPYHPYLCLLIAQCYLGRAMNRQSDNKNYQIAEGVAFLVRYRKFSPPSDECEVEFNFGRAFHSIGVTHLAVNHYEKVLKLTEEQMNSSDNPAAVLSNSVAREAAHNLVLIYTTSGSPRLAKERSRKWLAI